VDQLPHSLRRPQRERQLHLIGAFVCNPALHAPRLRSRQNSASSAGRNSPPVQQAFRAGILMALQPAVHHLPMHPHRPRRLALPHSFMQHEINRALA
jgi:hypothetical protein